MIIWRPIALRNMNEAYCNASIIIHSSDLKYNIINHILLIMIDIEVAPIADQSCGHALTLLIIIHNFIALITVDESRVESRDSTIMMILLLITIGIEVAPVGDQMI